MKTALPCKVSKTAIHRSAVVCLAGAQNRLRCWPKLSPRRLPTTGHSPKRHFRPWLPPANSQTIETAFPYPSIPTSNRNPGSFNPELCGGSLRSQTLAR